MFLFSLFSKYFFISPLTYLLLSSILFSLHVFLFIPVFPCNWFPVSHCGGQLSLQIWSVSLLAPSWNTFLLFLPVPLYNTMLSWTLSPSETYKARLSISLRSAAAPCTSPNPSTVYLCTSLSFPSACEVFRKPLQWPHFHLSYTVQGFGTHQSNQILAVKWSLWRFLTWNVKEGKYVPNNFHF